MTMQTAILGGGCFWCLDAVFREVKGVQQVVCGYVGGARPHPTYEQVCSGATGHAEVVAITFDPAVISFRELLAIFFAIHDPTTPDRQGNDIGTQYRSVIFCQGEAQAEAAEELIGVLEATQAFAAPIVTQVVSEPVPFWPAEDYHQNYYAQHAAQGYCQLVISPKLAKFRQQFARQRR